MKLPLSSDKIFDRKTAAQRVQAWKRQGDQVVFTNGCFDLLHPGHIDLLTKAKGLGDRLIIGLNSDASVKRLEKGEDRPVLDEGSRAVLLASLEMVDGVVLFEEDTPLRLIESLGPNILVKGEDYEGSAIVGKDHVENAGGRVVRLPILEGYSSSSIIDRIRNYKQRGGDG